MLFNSFEFALFATSVFALYWLLKLRGQNVLLLVASYLFYCAWDWRFLSLLIFQSLVDYVAGLGIGRNSDERVRKRYLIAAISINLLLLAIFKYFGFFIESAIGFLGWFGLEPNPPLLEILLPIGISFYTFQSITYSFDVYRRRLEPTRNLLNYALFVAYFPHMIAGPIQKANHLLPQIERPRSLPSGEQLRSGLFLILMGLFKKVAIADSAARVVNETFDAGSSAGSATLFIGMVAFALQIYGDFAGYSDCARGVSRLFGIELTRNFEQPYLSRNITEFWRTWHISLSTWLHDYLYVPLGGNQRGKLRTYMNLLITMLLGGLWHGASWTFVIWGGMHGLLLAAHRAIGGYAARGRPTMPRFRDVPWVLLTFVTVSVLWIFFRAETLTQATDYLAGMFSFVSGPVNLDHVILIVLSALAILVLDIGQRMTNDHSVVLRWRPVLRGATCALLLLGIVLWSGGEAQPFIYFQF